MPTYTYIVKLMHGLEIALEYIAAVVKNWILLSSEFFVKAGLYVIRNGWLSVLFRPSTFSHLFDAHKHAFHLAVRVV